MDTYHPNENYQKIHHYIAVLKENLKILSQTDKVRLEKDDFDCVKKSIPGIIA